MRMSADEEQRFRSFWNEGGDLRMGAIRLYEMGWSKEALIMERKAEEKEAQCIGWYEDLVHRAAEPTATKIAWKDVRKIRENRRNH